MEENQKRDRKKKEFKDPAEEEEWKLSRRIQNRRWVAKMTDEKRMERHRKQSEARRLRRESMTSQELADYRAGNAARQRASRARKRAELREETQARIDAEAEGKVTTDSGFRDDPRAKRKTRSQPKAVEMSPHVPYPETESANSPATIYSEPRFLVEGYDEFSRPIYPEDYEHSWQLTTGTQFHQVQRQSRTRQSVDESTMLDPIIDYLCGEDPKYRDPRYHTVRN